MREPKQTKSGNANLAELQYIKNTVSSTPRLRQHGSTGSRTEWVRMPVGQEEAASRI
jgi:hypothetical protein